MSSSNARTQERELTFEEVDAQIQNADLSEFENQDDANAQSLDLAAQLKKVCSVYKVVKPILSLVGNAPFLPSSWKSAVKTFNSVMSTICV
ncbi:MAG: hypothetical protein H7Z75_09655 [Ferruginibacter sp.]|nr:hypothetical protein [Cytophagales bacterium]